MVSTQPISLKSMIVRLLSDESRSLADLQAMTQVSMPTLRQALQELESADWVCPVGRKSSTGGRRATLFGLNDQTHLITGVHLELPAINMVAADLNGGIVDRVHYDHQAQVFPDEAVRIIVEYMHQIQLAHPERRILGIGVGMPGFIDPLSGQVLSVRAPQWRNYPLKARLEAELDLPVVIENDVDCMAVAELANIETSNTDDLFYLGFSEGAKVSMILGGRLYRGPFGNTGVIGEIIVAPDSHPDAGVVFQEESSVSSVCHTFDQRVAGLTSPSNTLQAIRSLSDRSEKFRAILNAAATEACCEEIMTEVLDRLAGDVAKLIQVLQPAILIIGGALSHMPTELRSYMERSIRIRLPSLISNHLLIKYATQTGARVAAIGAVHRFLQRYDVNAA